MPEADWDETEYGYFLSAFCEECAQALTQATGDEDIVPKDAYDVFLKAFRVKPTPQRLAALTPEDLERLRAAWELWLERMPIPLEAIHSGIAETLRRWPADEELHDEFE